MITEYWTVEASNAGDLCKDVSDKLKDGWKLYGSPTQIACGEDLTHFVMMQAMTRDEDDCD